MDPIHIDKAEAITALRAAAFTVTDAESSDLGRTLIHCFAGFLGADWDLGAAIEFVEGAEEIAWVDNLFNHRLAALKDDRLLCFDVPLPADRVPA